MKTKRILAILLSLAMLLSLCACGTASTSTETATTAVTVEETAAPVESISDTELGAEETYVAALADLDYAEEDDGNLLLAINIYLFGVAFPEDPDTSKLVFTGDFADAAGVLLKVDQEGSYNAVLNLALPVGDIDPEDFTLDGDITLADGLLLNDDGSPYESDLSCYGYYSYQSSDKGSSGNIDYQFVDDYQDGYRKTDFYVTVSGSFYGNFSASLDNALKMITIRAHNATWPEYRGQLYIPIVYIDFTNFEYADGAAYDAFIYLVCQAGLAYTDWLPAPDKVVVTINTPEAVKEGVISYIETYREPDYELCVFDFQ